MPKQRVKLPLRGDDGAWEPMMLVAALAAAMWLGYAIYGDRILGDVKVVSPGGAAASASVEAPRAALPASKS